MPEKRLTIVLGTFNGASHLSEQLESYVAQTIPLWDLWVSDDGSQDGTWDILEKFKKAHQANHDIRLIQGPQKGAAANYLSLLTDPKLPVGPVVLSDQDDIWHPHRLKRAATMLDTIQNGPALYGAQSLICDTDGHVFGKTKTPSAGPSFGNALVQNIISGHTAALNEDALALIRSTGLPRAPIPFHDWWLYQLISGSGGSILIDPEPTVTYRQHRQNVIGAALGFKAAMLRLGQIFDGTFQHWIASNTRALCEVRQHLLLPAQNQLKAVAETTHSKGFSRMNALRQAQAHRQTKTQTLILYFAAILGRI